MNAMTQIRLKAEDIKPGIGARVTNTRDELLSGELSGKLRELLEARGILLFPEIGFTDEEQIAFTKTLGTFAPEITDRGGKDTIHKITLDEKINPGVAAYLKGSLFWHIDGTMNGTPILASLLSCHQPSPKGTGNTGFANTYAAYEALDDDEKAAIDGYRVRHGAWATLFYYEPEPPQAMLEQMQNIGDVEIPLVWKHRSGRKSLVIGNTAYEITGKTALESRRILNRLREWSTSEPFSYSHEWSIGDLVIWDNTGTMHRAEPYDPACGRMMHRTKLEGEESFE